VIERHCQVQVAAHQEASSSASVEAKEEAKCQEADTVKSD